MANDEIMIVETSANQLFAVRETGDPDLAHVWIGKPVKRKKYGWVHRANAKRQLVRKEACTIRQTNCLFFEYPNPVHSFYC